MAILKSKMAILLGSTNGDPLIMRLYFIHGGKRVCLSSWLETAGWPINLIPLLITYLQRRRKAGGSGTKVFFMEGTCLSDTMLKTFWMYTKYALYYYQIVFFFSSSESVMKTKTFIVWISYSFSGRNSFWEFEVFFLCFLDMIFPQKLSEIKFWKSLVKQIFEKHSVKIILKTTSRILEIDVSQSGVTDLLGFSFYFYCLVDEFGNLFPRKKTLLRTTKIKKMLAYSRKSFN